LWTTRPAPLVGGGVHPGGVDPEVEVEDRLEGEPLEAEVLVGEGPVQEQPQPTAPPLEVENVKKEEPSNTNLANGKEGWGRRPEHRGL